MVVRFACTRISPGKSRGTGSALAMEPILRADATIFLVIFQISVRDGAARMIFRRELPTPGQTARNGSYRWDGGAGIGVVGHCHSRRGRGRGTREWRDIGLVHTEVRTGTKRNPADDARRTE